MRGAIWAAYSDTDALSSACTNCGAQEGHWCTRPDGRIRRVPCVARSAASIGSGNGRPYAPRDFSEPARPPERTDKA